jgi:hypothetical protein
MIVDLDLIITLIGTLLGLIVGWLSQRRATNAAREHSKKLERELEAFRHCVLSVERPPIPTTKPFRAPADLVKDVHKRAFEFQGADGRVDRARLILYFVAMGYFRSELDFAINQLRSSNAIRDVDKWWLEVR